MKNYYLLIKLDGKSFTSIKGIKKSAFSTVDNAGITRLARKADDNSIVVCTNGFDSLDREFDAFKY